MLSRAALHRIFFITKPTALTLRLGPRAATSITPLQTRALATVMPTNNSNIHGGSTADDYGLSRTNGYRQPVWIATEPYEKRPDFPKLDRNIAGRDLVIVGAGIAGIQLAYEACEAGLKVVLIDGRQVLAGETGRTSGHLSAAVACEMRYELIKSACSPGQAFAYGEKDAKAVHDSHQFAADRIGQIAEQEGIECEYRKLPAYMMVQVPDTHAEYSKHNDLPDEVAALEKLGIPHKYEPKGRIGEAYTGAVIEWPDQACYHPTKYLNGVLNVLKTKHADRFQAYTETRMIEHKHHGDQVTVHTEGGHTLEGRKMAMTTNVPLHVADIILKEAFYRTYCVAMKAPKGTFRDALVYDNADPYVYVRKTAHPDPNYEYIITGGEDHKVGQETSEGYGKHYENLEKWTRAHYPAAGEAEFRWSGQIVEPNDYIAFIGKNTGNEKNVYVATGDAGDGLTHGVIAGKLITDLITGKENPWAALYSPSRKPKPRTAVEEAKENINQNLQYKRWVATDVSNIEDIPKCSGAVMHAGLGKLGKPVAVYKDGDGKCATFNAMCPHLKGIVAWNATEMSWDCPVHGSRFDGVTGKVLMGPANHGLRPEDKEAEKVQVGTSG